MDREAPARIRVTLVELSLSPASDGANAVWVDFRWRADVESRSSTVVTGTTRGPDALIHGNDPAAAIRRLLAAVTEDVLVAAGFVEVAAPGRLRSAPN